MKEKTTKVKKVKFLHIADIHLDIKRYGLENRAKDFFLALKTVFENYAIKEKVNFVLIAGDLFDKKTVTPEGIGHAIECFNLLKEANIPIIAIEGNHDAHNFASESSWLRSLSKWGHIVLLEPEFENGKAKLKEWDETTRTGTYINLGSIRIYGNIWYGSTVSDSLTKIVDALRDVADDSLFNIMMLHVDINGMLNKHIKGLPVEKLTELKKYIDYLALGHTHKYFEVGDFGYNPGSLEACSVDEYFNERGALLVEVNGKKHKAKLVKDYFQRKIIRLKFEIDKDQTPEEFYTNFVQFITENLDASAERPIVEVIISGIIGFKSSLLNLNKIKDEINKKFNLEIFILKNHAIPVDFSSTVSDNLTRSEKEKQVITGLIAKDPRFSSNADKISSIVLEIKRLALLGEKADSIVEIIERNIN